MMKKNNKVLKEIFKVVDLIIKKCCYNNLQGESKIMGQTLRSNRAHYNKRSLYDW